MKIQIKNRLSGRVQFETDLTGEVAGMDYWFQVGFVIKKALEARAVLTDAVLTDAVLKDADLRGADLTGAVLRGADLTGAVLTDADLTGAVLTDADLRGAVLKDADLRGADLTDADLTGAVLTGADLTDAVPTGISIPIIPNIDDAILAQIDAGSGFDMGNWHTCDTTHCRAGWAITLAGKAGAALENKVGPAAAGALIYAVSRPGKPIPNFYASNEAALKDMRAAVEDAS